jgi:hypothetical protein
VAQVLWSNDGANKGSDHTGILLVVGLLLLISAGYIIARANEDPPSEADKYMIIEDIFESKD